MRRPLLTLLLCAVAGAAAAPADAALVRAAGGRAHLPAGAAAPDQAALPVGRAGRWLVDAQGRVVILHGLNMVAKRPPYLPSRMGFGADDARWLRDQGFNSVRLGVIASGVEPAPGVVDHAYLDDIAQTIAVLHAAGLATLVDLHQDYYTESTGGEGFPGWMVHDRPGLARLGVGRRDAAPFDGLWADDGGVQGAIADLWTTIAGRLRTVPGILGYDLFNEPYPGSQADGCAVENGCPAFDTGVLTPFFTRLIAGVRAADPERLVFVEPGVSFNQGAASWLGPSGDARSGFSFHVYCSEVAAARPCSVRRPQAFANAERQATTAGQVPLLTEFGATDDLAGLREVLDAADRAMVGWEEWAYFNEDPCCARPHEGLVTTLAQPPGPATVKQDKLATLARPAPVTIAGTPLGWSWDEAAGRFQVRWVPGPVGAPTAARRAVRSVPARVGGPASAGRAMRRARRRLPVYSGGSGAQISEIVVPPASVPGGWRVTVTGGRVVSGARQRTVRIRADAGAPTVTVVIDRT